MSRKAYPKAALDFLSQPPAPNQLFRKAILRRCQMSVAATNFRSGRKHLRLTFILVGSNPHQNYLVGIA